MKGLCAGNMNTVMAYGATIYDFAGLGTTGSLNLDPYPRGV